MLKCHDRKPMIQTSQERLRGNTRHSATECFPKWPHTFFLLRPPGTLNVNLQQSAFHDSLTHSAFQDLVPIKRRVRQVEALLTQLSIRAMLQSHTLKKQCSRHPQRGSEEIRDILQRHAFQDGHAHSSFQDFWHPSYLEAVLQKSKCPASRSTADTIANQRNAQKSRPKNHVPNIQKEATQKYPTFCNRVIAKMAAHILRSKTSWHPSYLEAAPIKRTV